MQQPLHLKTVVGAPYTGAVTQGEKEKEMAVMVVTKDNFSNEVLQSEKPVLVDFWATWCGPCRMMAPVVEAIAAEHPELKVGKVDVDENPELAQQFNVMSIPTLAAFKGGRLIGTVVGYRPKESVLDLFR